MESLEHIKEKIPENLYSVLEKEGIDQLRPSQTKSLKAGLLEGKNLLVCTPTASGKTLVAELAMMNRVLRGEGKAVYIVPLKALGTEKHKDFKRKYGNLAKVGISVGDFDASDPHIHRLDVIVCTSEKLDSLIRHHATWIKDISVVVVDEIHLLNDPGRGPTLEILITMLRQIIKNAQIIGLSATIGNEKELASWLGAELVHDTWRPVSLHKGVYYDGKIEFE
ncbi:DEAD/DEAH box helicase [Candidatus Woesearchaeota archaeon]|nr:DEAD/DEAH box helicase [Candidatus Woesearchaeota archaeon]